MIRFLLVASTVILFLIITIPVMIVEWIIGKFNMDLRNRSCLAIIKGIFRFIIWLSGVKVTINGYEKIPDDKPVLYVGNHNSYYDIVIGYTIVKGLTGFIAKKEMQKIPLLNVWMRLVNCLFLDRENIREGIKTIRKATDRINSGISIFIFPEGTRSKNGKMLPFKEGSLKMADKTGCPVIPVAFQHTADIFENHIPFIRKTNVTINIGDPIYTRELSKEDRKFLGSYTQQKISELLQTP